MASYRNRFGPHNPDETYVAHAFPEQLVDLGEVQMNYATVGDASKPALLLIPGQTESWWGYEAALPLLAEHFQVFAVDLRGQGRSTRTPGRYTLDNMGNDLVRFIDVVIGRPTVVSGLSSGGVLVRLAVGVRQAGPGRRRALRGSAAVRVRGHAGHRPGHPPGHRADVRPVEHLPRRPVVHRRLGRRARRAPPTSCPTWMQGVRRAGEEPPQNLKEYDPEWGRAFWTGTVAASCDHERMLRTVKVPVLLTHHFRVVDEEQGFLMGAMSDLQARRVVALLGEAGVAVDYRSFEQMGHSMHGQDPKLFVDTVVDWASGLPRCETVTGVNGPIVVGTDGSDTAAVAVRTATALAKTFGQPLHVVCAYHVPVAADGLALSAGVSATAGLDGGWVEEVLVGASAEAKESGVEVRTHSRAGNPAEAILDVADEVNADLIVVGNRGIGSKSRFILGNVPSRVVHHATCSTYVVNTKGP